MGCAAEQTAVFRGRSEVKPVVATLKIDRASRLAARPLGVHGRHRTIACARPTFNVVESAGHYGALNARTEEVAKDFVFVDSAGRDHAIATTAANGLATAGVVRPDAKPDDVDDWTYALNQKLLAVGDTRGFEQLNPPMADTERLPAIRALELPPHNRLPKPPALSIEKFLDLIDVSQNVVFT